MSRQHLRFEPHLAALVVCSCGSKTRHLPRKRLAPTERAIVAEWRYNPVEACCPPPETGPALPVLALGGDSIEDLVAALGANFYCSAVGSLSLHTFGSWMGLFQGPEASILTMQPRRRRTVRAHAQGDVLVGSVGAPRPWGAAFAACGGLLDLLFPLTFVLCAALALVLAAVRPGSEGWRSFTCGRDVVMLCAEGGEAAALERAAQLLTATGAEAEPDAPPRKTRAMHLRFEPEDGGYVHQCLCKDLTAVMHSTAALNAGARALLGPFALFCGAPPPPAAGAQGLTLVLPRLTDEYRSHIGSTGEDDEGRLLPMALKAWGWDTLGLRPSNAWAPKGVGTWFCHKKRWVQLRIAADEEQWVLVAEVSPTLIQAPGRRFKLLDLPHFVFAAISAVLSRVNKYARAGVNRKLGHNTCVELIQCFAGLVHGLLELLLCLVPRTLRLYCAQIAGCERCMPEPWCDISHDFVFIVDKADGAQLPSAPRAAAPLSEFPTSPTTAAAAESASAALVGSGGRAAVVAEPERVGPTAAAAESSASAALVGSGGRAAVVAEPERVGHVAGIAAARRARRQRQQTKPADHAAVANAV